MKVLICKMYLLWIVLWSVFANPTRWSEDHTQMSVLGLLVTGNCSSGIVLQWISQPDPTWDT